MSMKQLVFATAILGLSVFGEAASASEDQGLAGVLRQVVEQNLAAFNREDVAGTMNFVHTKSPEYESTQAALSDEFELLDARTELVDFHYIGHDDEFAVARVKLKTLDQSEEPFAANVLDTITVFHQENGVWKHWSNHILGVELIQ